MNRIIDLLQFLTESPAGMFSTITGILAIGIWLIIRFTRKMTSLELSQKHLGEGQKEIVKKIDQLSAEMHEGFRRVDERFKMVDDRFEKLEQKMDERFEKVGERFEKVDERIEKMEGKFDRKIETLSDKLDRNTEELRKDNANLRTDVKVLQHDRFSSNYTVLRMKKNRASNKRKIVPIY